MSFNDLNRTQQLNQLHREEAMRKAENHRLARGAAANKPVHASVLNQMGVMFVNVGEGLQQRYGADESPDTVTGTINQPA